MRPRIAPSAGARAMLLALAMLLVSGCGGDGGPSDNGDATGNATTPPSARGEPYTFAVIGDSHTTGIDNGILELALGSAVENGAAFIIHTGDVSNIGAAEEFRRYRELIDSAGVPVYSAPGNHDLVSSGDVSAFSEYIGPPYSSFDHAGDHFVLVDFSDETEGPDATQLQWLAADLTAHSGAPRQFIFTHIPLLEDEDLARRYVGEEAVSSSRALIEETSAHDNVAACFSGHLHGFLRYRVGAVDAWISGGGGAEPDYPPFIGFYHYLLVNVDGDGVRVDVVRLSPGGQDIQPQ